MCVCVTNREERCTRDENNDNDNDVWLEWRNHTGQVEKLLDHGRIRTRDLRFTCPTLYQLSYMANTGCDISKQILVSSFLSFLSIRYTYIRAVALDIEETSICFEISHPVLAM